MLGKKITNVIFYAIQMLLLASCCNKVDCEADGFKHIRFLSEDDGTDFILNQIYSLDDLSISPLLKNANGPIPIYDIDPLANQQYLVSVYVNSNTAGFVLKLDSLSADTLWAITSQTAASTCCDGITSFDAAVLNGDTLANSRFNTDLVILK